MAHNSGSSFSDFTHSSGTDNDAGDDLEFPFGRLETLGRDEIRETAYELFFTSCRSSPGFGGRNPVTFYPPETGGAANSGVAAVSSRIKRALGLRARRGAQPMRAMSTTTANAVNTNMNSPGPSYVVGSTSPGAGRMKQRPMTSAEIMRQQMGVTEQSDNRLRKTIMRTFVGQAGKRAESIILPLELLRQLKQSEFNDGQEYQQWQRRQLKILEAGLLLYPSVPLDRLNQWALRLREVIRSGELKPIDTGKNSELLRILINSAVSLAWRSAAGSQPETCHWADGFPLNIHLYLSLLRSIFDQREETAVLEEVDEMMELMKKTWITLGINKSIHNVCLAWTLFEQYVRTGQVEQDLLGATLIVLGDIAGDAKRPDRDAGFVKVMSPALSSMLGWAERKLMDYHNVFRKCTTGFMEKVLALAIATAKIMNDDHKSSVVEEGEIINSATSAVERYIKSSLKSAFTKMLENGNGKVDSMVVEVDEEPGETLVHMAKDTERLVATEKETYSPVLRKWHPGPTAVAVATLHSCYGMVLKQYLARITGLNNESVRVLQIAGKLEKTLVQMVVEDLMHSEDGGKAVVREMMPYDVDSIILSLMKSWITGRLRMGRECFNRAKETETWNPKSKSEPYAQSAVDLMKLAKVTVDEFFEIPVASREDLVQELADGLETLFQDYTTFVATCGTRQSYIPSLPPLTRCNQDLRLTTYIWKKAQSLLGINHPKTKKKPVPPESYRPRPSISRSTQRFYIRLNTLHFVLAVLHSIDKSLSFFGKSPSRSPKSVPRLAGPGSVSRRRIAPTRFDLARSALQSAVVHVSEVAAYRLIFVDSHRSFYERLYAGGVPGARINPFVGLLKQNLNLIVTILTDRAQAVAVKEVMKAAIEAFLMVLLAGGSERAFGRDDTDMIVEDLESLRRVFCTSGEGLVAEEVVEKEMEVAEGIVGLMGLPTEKLVEEFTTAALEASKIGIGGAGQKVPMPPTTGKWNRSDPNTILRVLCYRDDETANRFLKKTFQMAKRK